MVAAIEGGEFVVDIDAVLEIIDAESVGFLRYCLSISIMGGDRLFQS